MAESVENSREMTDWNPNQREKYKATQLWNEVIRAFRSNLPLKKHRYKLKMVDDSFTTAEAIDWLCGYLAQKDQFQHVSRTKALLLLEKFQSQGLFESLKGEKLSRLKDDNMTVYRFSNISPSKIARTPLALKQHQQIDMRRKLCESPSILRTKKVDTPVKVKLNNIPTEQIPPQPLPEMQLITRCLTQADVNNAWKSVVLGRLKTLTNDRFEVESHNIDADIIMHNANNFSSKGVCRVLDRIDDIPKATMQAMKCLANWPWYNSSINWPIYLGFERDVFLTVAEYFKQESPLIQEYLKKLFTLVIKIHEEKSAEFLVTQPVELSSQKSLESLVEEMTVGSPRAERLVATASSSSGDLKLSKKEFHIETEFGVDSPVTRLIVPKTELNWKKDRTPTQTTKVFQVTKSPLSMYFTKRNELEISPQGENSSKVVTKLKINVTADKFTVMANSPMDQTHAAMEQLSYTSLERTLDSLPGLVQSPELLGKVEHFKRPSIAAVDGKIRSTITGTDRPRFFRNLPGSRASIATSNHFASGKPTTAEFSVKQSRIPVRVLNEPGCRHSLAVTNKESQLNVQPVNRTFNHNLPGSRFSVASVWSGDISAALPISSASSASPASTVVESLQICCLLMPPKQRRHLQLLLRMMSKVAVNYCLKLDSQRTNRAVALDTFTECLIGGGDTSACDKATKKLLMKTLLDNHAQIFAPPDNLIKVVQERIEEIKRAKVSYVYERPTNLQFCNRISETEFETERVAESHTALLQLLDAILVDENLKPTEKKRQLKNFKKTHPDLYKLRFPAEVLVTSKTSRLAASFEKLRSLR